MAFGARSTTRAEGRGAEGMYNPLAPQSMHVQHVCRVPQERPACCSDAAPSTARLGLGLGLGLGLELGLGLGATARG